uniref:Uncharacterized protein n=1 Tax=Parascaris equorum TaxID=6256 RepID=A0A914RR33_PAREQ
MTVWNTPPGIGTHELVLDCRGAWIEGHAHTLTWLLAGRRSRVLGEGVICSALSSMYSSGSRLGGYLLVETKLLGPTPQPEFLPE